MLDLGSPTLALKPAALPAVPLQQRLQDTQAQQALADLFPHLRHEAYNALRDLFPTPSAQ